MIAKTKRNGKPDLDAKTIFVSSAGILWMMACAHKGTRHESILREVHSVSIAGTRAGWHIAKKGLKKIGWPNSKNPAPCPDHPNRRHYLIGC